ncbi:WhiB family transcriptional regulator [Nocardia asiatica]|uniref:WhiB family transcriptional regulator n=1 Tax=Nocardia asiatica TaxID=209252 RepID=UPI003EE2120D
MSAPDPAGYRDRPCLGVDQELFFSRGQNLTAVRRAQAICGRCPYLAGCAEWAAPVVRSGALSGCVIATVRVPAQFSNYRSQRLRDEAADQLEAVAASITEIEGAA